MNQRLHNISPERTRELGKMLVAAVQLELFLMLDDICEAGDVENELFDDLCCDTIQDGARDGFVNLTVELLISPGSGYKRLLQIRKDQVCFRPKVCLSRLPLISWSMGPLKALACTSRSVAHILYSYGRSMLRCGYARFHKTVMRPPTVQCLTSCK